MKINLIPQAFKDERTLAVSRSGDVLTINGESFDFSGLPDGGTIPEGQVPCGWVRGPVDRIGGSLHVNLLLPLGYSPSPEQCFPAPIIDPPNGVVALPAAPVPEPMPMPSFIHEEDIHVES